MGSSLALMPWLSVLCSVYQNNKVILLLFFCWRETRNLCKLKHNEDSTSPLMCSLLFPSSCRLHLSTLRSVLLCMQSWKRSTTLWWQRELQRTANQSRWPCLMGRWWKQSPGRPPHTRWHVESGQRNYKSAVIIVIWHLVVMWNKKRAKLKLDCQRWIVRVFLCSLL